MKCATLLLSLGLNRACEALINLLLTFISRIPRTDAVLFVGIFFIIMGMITYEYGAMSSKYSVKAENKLTAYVAMILQYDRSAHLIALYSPEECKKDSWMCFTGQISERLDEVFGGENAFDKYVEANADAIRESYKSIEQIV